MTKNSSVIKYVLALAFLLFVPVLAPIVAQADSPDNQIYFFWDLRGRESFFQVTNLNTQTVTVHVQLFNANTPNCAEFDFNDTFTTNDTHLYNVRDLSSINSGTQNAPILTNGFGFIAVTVTSIGGSPCSDCTGSDSLIGNFIIRDASGYEYRTNALGDGDTSTFTFNFNDLNGISLSDVVGIVVGNVDQTVVTASPLIAADFIPTLYDTAENPKSCPPVEFSCSPTTFDYGINQAIINSKGLGSICLGTDTNGFLRLTPADSTPGARFIVGFIGLNNGDGTGSLDAWWGNPSFD